MKLTLKRLLKEDLNRTKEEVPKWMDVVLRVINTAIEQLGTALSNRLTFEDNFLCKVETREFTHDAEQILNPISGQAANLRCTGVSLLSGGDLIVDRFGWNQKSDGTIGVTIGFDGGSSSTKATCRLLILLG
jgi:hypothetical protein